MNQIQKLLCVAPLVFALGGCSVSPINLNDPDQDDHEKMKGADLHPAREHVQGCKLVRQELIIAVDSGCDQHTQKKHLLYKEMVGCKRIHHKVIKESDDCGKRVQKHAQEQDPPHYTPEQIREYERIQQEIVKKAVAYEICHDATKDRSYEEFKEGIYTDLLMDPDTGSRVVGFIIRYRQQEAVKRTAEMQRCIDAVMRKENGQPERRQP